MKMLEQELVTLLKKAGLANVEVVADKSESEFDLDTALQAIDTSRSAIIRPAIEQEISDGVTKKIAGKVGGILERELVRQTGVDAKMFTEGMKDEEKIQIAIAHKVGMLDANQQDVSKQLDELLAKHNTDLEAVKGDYEGKLTEANKKYIDRDINEFIFSQLKDAPTPDGADKMVLAKDLKNYLEGQYYLGYDETKKEMGLFMKDNPQMPVLNPTGTSKVGLLDVAKDYFTPRSLWKEDMRHVNPADAMGRTPTTTIAANPIQSLNNGDNPVANMHASRQKFYQDQGLKP